MGEEDVGFCGAVERRGVCEEMRGGAEGGEMGSAAARAAER